MIYSAETVFIHVPKTGGMSITRFLVNALDCPVTVVAPTNARDHTMALAASPQAAAKLDHVEGRRHETSPEALSLIRARGWALPDFAFAVIRDPVDLLLSYYKHMRKPVVWKLRGMTPDTLRGDPRRAMELPFDAFCRSTLFYGMDDARILSYYAPLAETQTDIVPLPHIAGYLKARFGHHLAFEGVPLEHKNRSAEVVSPAELSAQTKAHVAALYPGLTELYQTALDRAEWQ